MLARLFGDSKASARPIPPDHLSTTFDALPSEQRSSARALASEGNVVAGGKSEAAPQRIAAIDILRLLAAVYVLVFHVAAVAGIPKHVLPPFELLGRTFSNVPSPFSLGATGVSLFFVISGYCMYRSLASRPRAVGAYFRDRFARIYPVYAIAVFSSYLVCCLLGVQIDLIDIPIKLLFLQGFVQQYHLTLNGAFWSMATEVQFYLMLPWLFQLGRRIGLDRFVVLSLIIALTFRSLVQWEWDGQPPIAGIVKNTFLMNLLPGRIVEFAIGMWIAGTPMNRANLLANWLIVPAGALAFGTKMFGPPPLAEPLLGIFFGCVLVLALHHARMFGKSTSIFAVLGRASYALFLIHLPIALLVAVLLPEQLGLYERFCYLLLATLAGGIPISLALYGWIEMPLFRRLRKKGVARVASAEIGDGGAP
jgi:peptidoglycan/LPS O-acetylase OafA/YrhL